MAVRAIDNRRVYKYVLEIERRVKAADGSFIKNEDGTFKLMTVAEALAVAEANAFTVIHVRGRTVRQYAEERDRMIEVINRKGELVQKIATGTMDMNLLLSGLVGWERMLPPVGMCERCGVVHKQDGYLEWNDLINSAANKGDGIYRTEICVDHLSESSRGEILSFMRNMGEEELGEG